ncbi:MAG: ester cyclase [Alphaproteobacteria bacterium]|nr:ester cyclase [Alphaproteobacteria bacterium]
MSAMSDTAMKFFEACEAGKGWDACAPYCTADASFAAQSEPLADVKTLADYANWMQGLMTILPDAGYDLKSWAIDADRNNVSAYAVFNGTHTGEGGPMPPTGKSASTDYVYVMQFSGDKISHMTKIWNAPWALKQLGWM